MSFDDTSVDAYSILRHEMVDTQLRARGVRDERVLDAMLQIPRHEFVAEQYRAQAYEDHPLPIAEEQTISQPFIIALSLQALALQGTESVLEIGTGSGYQTALLTLLARAVYSIERHERLGRQAEILLRRLGLNNVRVMVGDGSRGWPEHAPFDAILVSAAAPRLPDSLFQQLTEGGRTVIPIGPQRAQTLQLFSKVSGKPLVQVIEGCRFVPLIGTEGY